MSFVSYLFSNIIIFFAYLYPTFGKLNSFLGTFFSIILYYRIIYFLIGIFFTRKFPKAKNKHKYGIVIAARNEEKVIGNLLDSINRQDYPKDLITTFVVADNCNDRTAEIAKNHGAICYERFNNNEKTKGYALRYLFEQIEKDYGTKTFEGYFVFDADNLLKRDYITKMNDAFDSGEKIITSYRHSKNFDENWISSTYAIHWLRSIRTGHRARSIFRLATNIQGTGFLFTNEIVENGWKYTSLTEDRALTVDAVSQGYQISYQDEAIFYDEQPTSLKIAWRQRLRWSKGHLMAFVETGPKLFRNILFGQKYLNKYNQKHYDKKYKNIIESIRHRFASFDILTLTTPFSVINIIRFIFISLFLYSCYAYSNGISYHLIGKSTYLGKLLYLIFPITIREMSGFNAFIKALILVIWSRIFYRIGKYLENIFEAIYIFIIERKRIKKIPFYKKVLYCFTWPIFDIIGRYTTYIAVFKKVEWKPIPHDSKITISDIDK